MITLSAPPINTIAFMTPAFPSLAPALAVPSAFAADMAAALPVTDPATLAIPDSPLTRIVRRYLFNQL